MMPKDRFGDEFGYWTDKALQIAAFYWRRPWWELSILQIQKAWEEYSRKVNDG